MKSWLAFCSIIARRYLSGYTENWDQAIIKWISNNKNRCLIHYRVKCLLWIGKISPKMILTSSSQNQNCQGWKWWTALSALELFDTSMFLRHLFAKFYSAEVILKNIKIFLTVESKHNMVPFFSWTLKMFTTGTQNLHVSSCWVPYIPVLNIVSWKRHFKTRKLLDFFPYYTSFFF